MIATGTGIELNQIYFSINYLDLRMASRIVNPNCRQSFTNCLFNIFSYFLRQVCGLPMTKLYTRRRSRADFLCYLYNVMLAFSGKAFHRIFFSISKEFLYYNWILSRLDFCKFVSLKQFCLVPYHCNTLLPSIRGWLYNNRVINFARL